MAETKYIKKYTQQKGVSATNLLTLNNTLYLTKCNNFYQLPVSLRTNSDRGEIRYFVKGGVGYFSKQV